MALPAAMVSDALASLMPTKSMENTLVYHVDSELDKLNFIKPYVNYLPCAAPRSIEPPVVRAINPKQRQMDMR